MLNSPIHTTSKILAAKSYLVLIILITSCSVPNFETPSETEQQAFIEITDSAIQSSVETTIEIPLESSLETTIELPLKTTDETLARVLVLLRVPASMEKQTAIALII